MANRKFYTGFPTSHLPRFYAAPNFLKMGIKYLKLSSFGQFRQYRTKSLLQSFIIQELIRRRDSERELLYDDNIHVEASAYAN